MKDRIEKITGIVLIIGLFTLIPLFMSIKQEKPCLTCETRTTINKQNQKRGKIQCINLGFYIACSSNE